MSKKCISFLVLLMLLSGCTKDSEADFIESHNKETTESSTSQVTESSEKESNPTESEDESIVNIKSVSLEEAGLKFNQSYYIPINDEDKYLHNIHTSLDVCTLAMCEVVKEKGLEGEAILIGIDLENPIVTLQTFKLEDLAVINDSYYTDNTLWSNEHYAVVDMNAKMGISTEGNASEITKNINQWIVDRQQAIGSLFTYDAIPEFTEFKSGNLNFMIRAEEVLPSLDFEYGQGGIYYPELAESGDALIINATYSQPTDMDVSSAVVMVLQMFQSQSTMKDGYIKINGTEIPVEQVLNENTLYNDGTVVIVDVLDYIYNTSTIEEALAAQGANSLGESSYSWASPLYENIKEQLLKFLK